MTWMMRMCIDCGLVGCKNEKVVKLCNDCHKDAPCPITDTETHGICDFCMEQRRLGRKNEKNYLPGIA